MLTTKIHSFEKKQNFPSKPALEEKPFAVGQSFFKHIHRYSAKYIDKTKAIKKFVVDSKNETNVTLLLGPRRFGKSLFLTTLYSYFNCLSPQEAQIKLFSPYAIWNIQNGEYRKYCGQYAVVRITLKDTNADSFKRFLGKLHYILKELQRDIIQKYNVSAKGLLVDFLFLVTHTLAQKHGPVILLIDEVDVPFRYALKNGYYDKFAAFMEKFLWRTLRRENTCLGSAILTGISPIPFPHMPNIKVCTVLNKDLSDAIGFTLEETKIIFSSYANGKKALNELIKNNGFYYIGRKKVFDAWSVINTANDLIWANSRRLRDPLSQTSLEREWEKSSKCFWVKSGCLGNLIMRMHTLDKWRLKKLLERNNSISVNKKINPFDILSVFASHSIIKNQQALWLSLLFIGYLTDISDEHSPKTKLIVANKDIHYELANELNRALKKEGLISTPFHFFYNPPTTKKAHKPVEKTRKEMYELGNRYMSNRYT